MSLQCFDAELNWN